MTIAGAKDLASGHARTSKRKLEHGAAYDNVGAAHARNNDRTLTHDGTWRAD